MNAVSYRQETHKFFWYLRMLSYDAHNKGPTM